MPYHHRGPMPPFRPHRGTGAAAAGDSSPVKDLVTDGVGGCCQQGDALSAVQALGRTVCRARLECWRSSL